MTLPPEAKDLGTLEDWFNRKFCTTGVYAIIGPVSTYIGQSINVESRIAEHARTVYGPDRRWPDKTTGPAILRGQKSEGPMRVMLLQECPEIELDSWEAYWINFFVTLGIQLANRAPGGGLAKGSISMNEWVKKQRGS